MNKTLLKIVAATSMCIFALLAAFAGSAAWFNATQTANQDADQMAIGELPNFFGSLSFHAKTGAYDSYLCFSQTASGLYTTESEEVVYSGSSEVPMQEYDLLNQHQEILMLLTLSEDHTCSSTDAITVTLSTSEGYLGEIDSEGNPTLSSLPSSGNPLSSIIRFGCLAYSEDDFTSLQASAQTAYDSAATSTSTEGEPYFVPEVADEDFLSFVTFSGDTPTFTSTLDLFNLTSGTYKYLVVVIDYYAESLDWIYTIFLGSTALDSDLLFTCDWGLSM